MPRHWRLSARSSASPVNRTSIVPGTRPSPTSVTRISSRIAAANPGVLVGLATEIGIRGARAALAGILGVRRAHVEDRGEHGEERLADARQLLQREPALVELPLLH